MRSGLQIHCNSPYCPGTGASHRECGGAEQESCEVVLLPRPIASNHVSSEAVTTTNRLTPISASPVIVVMQASHNAGTGFSEPENNIVDILSCQKYTKPYSLNKPERAALSRRL